MLVPDTTGRGRTQSQSSGSPTPNSPVSPTGGGIPERSCDGCFNKLSFEAIHWQQLQCKAKRDLEKIEAEEALLVRSMTPPPPIGNGKSILFSGGSGDKHSNLPPAPNTSQTINTLNDTKNALEKRGEMQNQVSKSGQQLNEVSWYKYLVF